MIIYECRGVVAFWACCLGIHMVLYGPAVLGIGKGTLPVR